MSARLAALKARLDEQAKAKEATTPKPRSSTDVPATPTAVSTSVKPSTSTSTGNSVSSTTAGGTLGSTRYASGSSTPISSRLTEAKTPLVSSTGGSGGGGMGGAQAQAKIENIVDVLTRALGIPGPKTEFVDMLVKGIDPGFRVMSLRNTTVKSKLKGKIAPKSHELLESRLAKLQIANAALSDSAMLLFSSIFEDKSLATLVNTLSIQTQLQPSSSSTTHANSSTVTSVEPSPAKALLIQKLAARTSLSAPMKSPPPPPKPGSSPDFAPPSIQPPDLDSGVYVAPPTRLSVSAAPARLSASYDSSASASTSASSLATANKATSASSMNAPNASSRLSTSSVSSSPLSSSSSSSTSLSSGASATSRGSSSLSNSKTTTASSTTSNASLAVRGSNSIASSPTNVSSSAKSSPSALSSSASTTTSVSRSSSSATSSTVPSASASSNITTDSLKTSTASSLSTTPRASANSADAATLKPTSASVSSISPIPSPITTNSVSKSKSATNNATQNVSTSAHSTADASLNTSSASSTATRTTAATISANTTTTTTTTTTTQAQSQTQASSLLERLKKAQDMNTTSNNNNFPSFHISPADSGLLDLRFGDQVVLRTHSGLFVGVPSLDKNVIRSNTSSKGHNNKSGNNNGDILSAAYSASFPFVLLNPSDLQDRGPIRFQHLVYLACGGGGSNNISNSSSSSNLNFLNVEPSGQVKIKNASNNPSGSSSSIGEKWTIVSVQESNLKAEGPLKIYDKIALKSSSGPFLTCNENVCMLGSVSLSSALQMFELSRADLPFAADWERKRYYDLHENLSIFTSSSSTLTSSTLSIQQKNEKNKIDNMDKILIENFNALPSCSERERILLEELLNALMTIEGKFIVVLNIENNIPNYEIHKEITDQSLITLMKRILPVCSYFAIVRNYIHTCSRFEYGFVHHALCSALKEIEQTFLLVVVQLEKQFLTGLTLLRTWFYLQPYIHLLERVSKLVKKAMHVRGGSLCNLIYEERQREGDAYIREQVYDMLLMKITIPYFSFLSQWIYQGIAEDPYNEFQIFQRKEMVKENINQNFYNSYWDEKFSIREEHLPIFLENVSQKILLTGKYLNVVRECGRPIQSPFFLQSLGEENGGLKFSFNPRDYEDAIQAAYIFACQELLNIVMKEERLTERLASLKRYFFLQQGDFFTHFMDIAESELDTDILATDSSTLNNPVKLASLLELALRTSNAVSDPFSDDVSCSLQQFSLLEKLNAAHNRTEVKNEKVKPLLKKVEGFTLTYKVRFPLTLVISKTALTKYQLIFRLLFSCKHVERALERTWSNHQGTKEFHLRAVLHKSFALRYRMLSFWQNLLYYFMAEVLEPNFCELLDQLEKVVTVDDVLYFHNAFLDRCLRECLLTSHDLILVLSKLTEACSKFAQNTETFFSNANAKLAIAEEQGEADKKVETVAQRRLRLRNSSERVRHIVNSKPYATMVDAFVTRFDSKLVEFINLLRTKSSSAFDNHLTNLLTRLNFNDYFENPSV